MLTSQKDLFSLPKEITYFNCAYMSPMMKSVEEAGQKALLEKRTPHTITPDKFFEDTETLRQEYAKLINATDPNSIVVIPSVSYGIATAIKNIPLSIGDEVILMEEQFPSNYYGWEKAAIKAGAIIKTIEAPDQHDSRAKKWNQKILDAITPATKVVSMPHVHWADGTLFDLVVIRRATNDVGAFLVIDGTQSVGALPFDIQQIQPDALICGGYKWLLGPYSIGLAYFGERFEGGEPLEENWMNRLDSENFSQLVNYQPKYQPGMLRYEVGEHSNFNLVPMLIQSIRQLSEWQPSEIQKYCETISQEAVSKLRSAGFWIEDDNYRSHHLFGIRLPDHLGVSIISEKLKNNNIYVSVRGNAIRVAPHLYNDESDFERLVGLLI